MGEQLQQRRAVSHDGETHTPKRASFMSPTKASLARFYPDLLPQRDPAIPRRRGSTGRSDGNTQSGAAGLNRMRGHLHETPLKSRVYSDGISSNLKLSKQKTPASLKRSLTTPLRHGLPLKKSKTVIPDAARASPPELRNGETECEASGIVNHWSDTKMQDQTPNVEPMCAPVTSVIDSQKPCTPTRSDALGIVTGMGLDVDGEPCLPLTPVHLRLEKPLESPKGLLRSGDTRSVKQKSNMSAKSSPLKRLSSNTAEAAPATQRSQQSLGRRIYIVDTPRPPPTTHELRKASMTEDLARLEKELKGIEDGLIRQLLVYEWESIDGAKRKEISRRKKQVKMESVRVLRLRENLYCSGVQDTVDGRSLAEEPGSHNLSHDFSRQSISNAPPRVVKPSSSLSQSLARFLPFSERPLLCLPNPVSLKPTVTPQSLSLELVGDHHVALNVSSSDVKLFDGTLDETLYQSQNLVISSLSSSFNVEFVIAINLSSQMIMKMQLKELSDWAEEGLGTWLRISRKDLGLPLLGKTLKEFLRSCLDRLRCWKQIAQDFGDLIPIDDNKSPLLRSSSIDSSTAEQVLGQRKWFLTRDNVTLGITWQIGIDDQGGIQNQLSLEPVFPETWVQGEFGAELLKLREVFNSLQEKKGIAPAIAICTRLVFPL